MAKNPTARFVPLIVFPAILPAILLPVFRSHQVPDAVQGAVFGFSIGLTLVGLGWMARRGRNCSTDG